MQHIRQVYDANVTKIDNAAVDGLTGVADSLAYKVAEIERHLYSYEHWMERAAVPNAEIHVADSIGSGLGSFLLDAGNLTWGAWVQLLGSGDTPHLAGNALYDMHRLLIEATELNDLYFLQIGFGASGAAALAAFTYTELVVHPLNVNQDSGPIEMQIRRQAVGTKAWARCMSPGNNTATINFFFGIHEYEG